MSPLLKPSFRYSPFNMHHYRLVDMTAWARPSGLRDRDQRETVAMDAIKEKWDRASAQHDQRVLDYFTAPICDTKPHGVENVTPAQPTVEAQPRHLDLGSCVWPRLRP